MKRTVLGIGLAAVVPGTAAIGAVEQTLVVVNQTGVGIDELYLSVSRTENWGDDLLAVDVLGNGDNASLKVSRKDTDCLWDLRIIDQQGNGILYQGLDLCKGSEITLKYDKGQPTFSIR